MSFTRWKLRSLGAALTLSLALAGAACTKKEDDGHLQVYHGAHQDSVKSIDPANAYDSISLDVVPNIYETLYQYDYLAETYRTIPLLAADMPKYSADRLTVTIPIKRGIRYQDDKCFPDGKGREVKAQDFIYGMKRLAHPGVQSQGWWIFDGKIVGINAFQEKLAKAPREQLAQLFGGEIEGLRALDDYTIQIKLVKPYPQLLYILSMSFTAPMPHEAIKEYADDKGNLNENAVGTGPFTLKSWDRGHRLVLERNPNYHPEFYPTQGSAEYRKRGLLADAGKTLPFLDRIVLNVMKEPQPQWLGFMRGELDLMPVPKDNFATAITNQVNLSPELAAKGIRLNIATGVRFYFINFNMKDKVLGENKFLRQAISSAISREKWIETFTNGRGRKMVNALPPGLPDRPKTDKIKYDFDLARAKELMKKAGYPDGKGLPPISMDMRGADSVSRQMGEFFMQQFAQIGIQLNVIYNTFPAYLQKEKEGNLQISYGGWAVDYPDGENVFQLLYGPNKAPGPNAANFQNPQMDKLYEQISVMESGPKRAALMQQMDDILQEELPWAMGYYHAEYRLSQPWLINYRADGIIPGIYKYVRIDKEVKKRYRETAK